VADVRGNGRGHLVDLVGGETDAEEAAVNGVGGLVEVESVLLA